MGITRIARLMAMLELSPECFHEVTEYEHELREITEAIARHVQSRPRLADGGTKRNRGKKKFHEYHRECELLKQILYQLESTCELKEIQESKLTLMQKLKNVLEDSCRGRLGLLPIGTDLEKLHFRKYELEWNLQEINCQLKKIENEPQRQEILLRIAYFSSLLACLLVLYAVYVEDAHQGGFRNSLLDGWWLEFWEIVLLAAGDVERNPGPRQITDEQLAEVSDTPIGEDDYFEVITSVSTLCAKWHDFCLALGLPPSLLSSIRKDYMGDSKGCLREGLTSWLQQNYDIAKHGLPSWRRLVEAVDHPAGGDAHALALKIAKEHKQPQVLPAKEGSVSAPIPAAVCSVPKKSQAMSTAFANMYRTISRLLQSVQVDELKDYLRYLCNPQSPRQLCVDRRVYKRAKSTKRILKKLCPRFINHAELFILRSIVKTFGSHQCKKHLRDFQNKFTN